MSKDKDFDGSREQEFNENFEAIYEDIWKFSRFLTRNEDSSKDLFQNTWFKAKTNYHQFQSGTNFKAWVVTIMRMLFYSDMRTGRRRSTVDLDSSQNEMHLQTGPDSSIESRELIPLLGHLTPDQLDCILGIFVCNYTYKYLSLVMGVSTGTIKARTSRGRKQLMRLIHSGVDPGAIDISSWKYASEGVRSDSLYFPIARAYEDLYSIWKGELREVDPHDLKMALEIQKVLDSLEDGESYLANEATPTIEK